MRVKVIKRFSHSGPQREKRPAIGIQKLNIGFNLGFIQLYGIKRFCVFAENEDGMLCFKMMDRKSEHSFYISETGHGGYHIHTPKSLRDRIVKFGKYDVVKRGEWFATDCLLRSEDTTLQ